MGNLSFHFSYKVWSCFVSKQNSDSIEILGSPLCYLLINHEYEEAKGWSGSLLQIPNQLAIVVFQPLLVDF